MYDQSDQKLWIFQEIPFQRRDLSHKLGTNYCNYLARNLEMSVFSEIQSYLESIIYGVLGSCKYVCVKVSRKLLREKVTKQLDDNFGLQFENLF